MHVVNTLEEGRAVLGKGIAQLISPPYAACHAGVNYYRHLVDALAAEFPDVDFEFTLDCGDDPAIAYEARCMGFTSVQCSSPLDPSQNAAKACS